MMFVWIASDLQSFVADKYFGGEISFSFGSYIEFSTVVGSPYMSLLARTLAFFLSSRSFCFLCSARCCGFLQRFSFWREHLKFLRVITCISEQFWRILMCFQVGIFAWDILKVRKKVVNLDIFQNKHLILFDSWKKVNYSFI